MNDKVVTHVDGPMLRDMKARLRLSRGAFLDWGDLPDVDREGYVRSMRAAFAAAGIEVQS